MYVTLPRRRYATISLLLLFCCFVRDGYGQKFDSGSNGSDGALNLTMPGPITFDPKSFPTPLDPDGDNVYHFTTINIASGVTLRLTNKKLTGPVYWLATGDVTIAGIVDLSGEKGHPFAATASERIPAAGGPGGYDGGVGGNQTAGFPSAQPGNGPGGGIGTYVVAGRTCGSGGTFTGSQFLIPLIGGSGGAGGTLNGSFGAGGGGGGGAILIASTTSIKLASGAAQILAHGGHGGSGQPSCPNQGDGGNGSGGAIRLIAPLVVGGTLSAYGGNWTGGPYAGNGIIRIEADTFGGASAVDATLVLSTPLKPMVPLTPPSSLRVTSLIVNGVTIPINANPFSFPDAPISAPGPVTVNVEALYIPTGTIPKIIVMSETGLDQTVNCTTGLAGTLQRSTCSAQIIFPIGGSRGFVKATWTQ